MRTYLCHLEFARLLGLLGVGVVVGLDDDQVAAVLVDGELTRRVLQRVRHLDNGDGGYVRHRGYIHSTAGADAAQDSPSPDILTTTVGLAWRKGKPRQYVWR